MPVVEDGTLLNIAGINEAFAGAYKQLVNEETMKCDKYNVVYDPVCSPTCAIVDVSMANYVTPTGTHDWFSVYRRGTSFIHPKTEPRIG